VKLLVSDGSLTDSTSLNLIVNSTPAIVASNDTTIKLGTSLLLNATGSGGTYSWSPPIWLSCVVCSSTVSTPEESIIYTVTVIDSNGCVTTDEVTIVVDYEKVIFVPNVFSPNLDGENDVLYVRGKGVEAFSFYIYDRWGELIFETSDSNIGWDGTYRGQNMNKAVFVYYLEAIFMDGSEITQKGDITLMR